MLSQMAGFPLSCGCIIFHSINIPLLLTHSFVNGHLGYLHTLAIINKVAVNRGYRYSFRREISCPLYTNRSGIIGSYGSVFNFFEETPYCFPEWLYQFTVSPTVYKIFLSPALVSSSLL